MKVKVEINRRNVVTNIENNEECDGFRKAKIEVGDKLKNEFLALLMMNPHRFEIVRSA